MYISNRYTYKFKLNYTVLDKDGDLEQYEKYVTRGQVHNRMKELEEYPHIRDLIIEEIEV